MVTELKEVLLKLEKLNDEEQMKIAKLLQDELAWQKSLDNSQEQLSQLANEAIGEYKSGKTKQSDW